MLPISSGTMRAAGGRRGGEAEERALASQDARRLQARPGQFSELLDFLESKCSQFTFDPSWLWGKWLACSDAIEEVGAALCGPRFVRATSSPIVLGELFCFAAAGITLMLLSMSYIDRFESIFSIPPFRNRCWVASVLFLLLVIVLAVTTRVTLHWKFVAATPTDSDPGIATGAHLSPLASPEENSRVAPTLRSVDEVPSRAQLRAPRREGENGVDGASKEMPREAQRMRQKSLAFAALRWPHWSLCLVAVILWVCVIAVDELVKRVERQTHEKNQKYLKVLFATRLGMWSPK